jgi:integrase
MARPATGQVVCDERRVSPVFALRFRAYGRREYVTLGSVTDGWTQERAELELQNVLADVRRGIWRPPHPEPAPVAPTDPTFHEFASQWFAANEGAWRPKTRIDYGWQLTNHLLPFFATHLLSQITIAEVDRYRTAKVREGVLGATSVNKTITRLAQILEVAVEYEIIGRNPAKGRRRRVKASKPAPVWLDRAGHIAALIDAAGELDREARADRHVPRRAILSTLVFAGLRIGELCDLCWRDVDLSGGRITVRASKTDAGVRHIDLLPVLRDELLALKASAASAGASELVFATMAGGRPNPSNIRSRVLIRAVKRANERLEAAREVPLPDRLSPHKLRHTFASLLVALGCDPGSVMDQLGHTDPGFTLRVYRHGMRRDEASRVALRELVGLGEWAAMGSSGDMDASTVLSASEPGMHKSAVSRAFE